jgi:2-keto-4-pentenoate hydratase/2-oxohepta-3-ene-1,7-dioic acid hydratase in catechol pathway
MGREDVGREAMSQIDRRTFMGAGAALAAAGLASGSSAQDGPLQFVRFEAGGTASHGLVEGDRVRAIAGDLFGAWSKTERTHAWSEVKLLAPVAPRKVFALAGMYRSHLGGKPVPKVPEAFFKLPTCIVGPGAPVEIPPGTADCHYEAELVLVIGKGGKNIPEADAGRHIFGATAGNDISARDWQKGDVQWWRAKGCDTFGPIGPGVVSGIRYDDLLLQLRLNGEVKQKQRTSDHLIFNCAQIVSFLSRHVTLEPGDLIFTGTPGTTSALKPGDVVEVDLEGVGVLRNPVAAGR